MISIILVVVVLDLIMYVTIKFHFCVTIHVHVCAVYGLYEMSWFVGSVLQKIASVCILLLAIGFLRYCLIVTGVLHVLHDYSASFHHPHWVGLSSVVMTLPFMITPCIT